MRIIVELILYCLSGFFIRKKNRIIFGAWRGDRYADNSKYMLEYLMNYDQYELIWCGKKHVEKLIPKRSNIKFTQYGTLKSIYYAATAEYAVITHNRNDITKYNVFRGAKVVQLWHGVGIKKLGISNEMTLMNKIKYRYRLFVRKYDYFICSSELNKERNMKARNKFLDINANNIINSGQPRNDILLEANDEYVQEIRKKYYVKYQVPADKKIIIYMPTYRKNKTDMVTMCRLSKKHTKELERILNKHNVILLEKSHYKDRGMVTENHKDYVYNLSGFSDIDTQELLLISDMLITDYSSCYMDYTLLNRPIIHFSYDYQKYMSSDQGLYYDLQNVIAGTVVTSLDDLLRAVDEGLNDVNIGSEKRVYIRNTMMEYDCGKSCETIFKEIDF